MKNTQYIEAISYLGIQYTVYGRDWLSRKPRGYDKKWYIHFAIHAKEMTMLRCMDARENVIIFVS